MFGSRYQTLSAIFIVDNIGGAIYVGRATTVVTFQLNILTGTFLLVSCSNNIYTKSIVVCARSRPNMALSFSGFIAIDYGLPYDGFQLYRFH